MYGYYGMGYFGWIWMVLFWGAVIWFIVWLVRQGHEPQHNDSAMDILKQRYAKGEISKKEFDEMKKEMA